MSKRGTSKEIKDKTETRVKETETNPKANMSPVL